MPNIPAEIYAPLGEISRGLNIPTTGASSAIEAAYHAAREIRVGTEAVANAVEVHQRHQDIQETTDLNNGIGDAELNAREGWKQEVANNPHADPKEFFDTHVAPGLDKLGETATSDTTRAHYGELRNRIHIGLLTEWSAERSKLDSDSAVNAADSAYKQAGITVSDDPASLGMQMDLVHSKVAAQFKAAGVPLDQKDAHFAEMDDRLAYSAADSLAHQAESGKASQIQIDAARAAITDPKGIFHNTLSPQNYNAIKDRLDKAQATAGDAAGLLAKQQLVDVYKQMQNNGGVDVQGRGASLIQSLPERTPEQIATKSEAMRNYESALSYGKVADDLWLAPESSLPKIAQGVQDAAKTETDPDKLRQLQAGTHAIFDVIGNDGRGGARAKALEKDAPGYVNLHSPSAASAYSEWQQNPTPQTWSAYATVQTAIQQKMRPDEPVHLITPEIKTEAQDIVRSITQTPEGAAGASQKLYQMAQTFGNSWHSIAHDLMDSHVITREQYAAARLYGDPSRQGEAERILTASAMKGGDRFDLHGIPEEKARKAAIGALSGFEATLGNVNDRGEVLSGFTDALTHILQAGGDASPAAATREAQKMILDENQFVGATHTIRAPANLNGDAITTSSEAALAGIGNRAILVPRSNTSLNESDQRANYIRTLQLTGKWYTNADGSGVNLYDSDMHNVMERFNGKLVPVTMKWSDLTPAAAAAATADKQPYSFGKL